MQQEKKCQKFPCRDKDTGNKYDRADEKLSICVKIEYAVEYSAVLKCGDGVCLHDREDIRRYKEAQCRDRKRQCLLKGVVLSLMQRFIAYRTGLILYRGDVIAIKTERYLGFYISEHYGRPSRSVFGQIGC